jgi:hypothetical protein
MARRRVNSSLRLGEHVLHELLAVVGEGGVRDGDAGGQHLALEHQAVLADRALLGDVCLSLSPCGERAEVVDEEEDARAADGEEHRAERGGPEPLAEDVLPGLHGLGDGLPDRAVSLVEGDGGDGEGEDQGGDEPEGRAGAELEEGLHAVSQGLVGGKDTGEGGKADEEQDDGDGRELEAGGLDEHGACDGQDGTGPGQRQAGQPHEDRQGAREHHHTHGEGQVGAGSGPEPRERAEEHQTEPKPDHREPQAKPDDGEAEGGGERDAQAEAAGILPRGEDVVEDRASGVQRGIRGSVRGRVRGGGGNERGEVRRRGVTD